jgi:hypothetical protein
MCLYKNIYDYSYKVFLLNITALGVDGKKVKKSKFFIYVGYHFHFKLRKIQLL